MASSTSRSKAPVIRTKFICISINMCKWMYLSASVMCMSIGWNLQCWISSSTTSIFQLTTTSSCVSSSMCFYWRWFASNWILGRNSLRKRLDWSFWSGFELTNRKLTVNRWANLAVASFGCNKQNQWTISVELLDISVTDLSNCNFNLI